MRKPCRSLLIGLSFAVATPAQAQTTNCQWFGAVWSCSGTPAPAPSPGIQWDRLQQPNNSVMESFQRGAETAQRARQAQMERERIQAETELYRAQAQAVRNSGPPLAPASTPQITAPAQPDHIQRWRAAAQPRMGLFPDFEEVVFANDVTITPSMVDLMSGSPYAADIAYYLATHQAEASVLSRLPLLDVARAIDRIERQIKLSEDQPAQPPETERSP